MDLAIFPTCRWHLSLTSGGASCPTLEASRCSSQGTLCSTPCPYFDPPSSITTHQLYQTLRKTTMPATTPGAPFRPERHCLVTIGATARFTQLLREVLRPAFLDHLVANAFTHLTLQCGKDLAEVREDLSSIPPRADLQIATFDFVDDLVPDMVLCRAAADGTRTNGVVIAHAGKLPFAPEGTRNGADTRNQQAPAPFSTASASPPRSSSSPTRHSRITTRRSWPRRSSTRATRSGDASASSTTPSSSWTCCSTRTRPSSAPTPCPAAPLRGTVSCNNRHTSTSGPSPAP